jgi:hypothetical protein
LTIVEVPCVGPEVAAAAPTVDAHYAPAGAFRRSRCCARLPAGRN